MNKRLILIVYFSGVLFLILLTRPSRRAVNWEPLHESPPVVRKPQFPRRKTYCESHPSACLSIHIADERVKSILQARKHHPYISRECEYTIPIRVGRTQKVKDWWGHIFKDIGGDEMKQQCPVKCDFIDTDNINELDMILSIDQFVPASKTITIFTNLEFMWPVLSAHTPSQSLYATFDPRSDIPLNYFYGMVCGNEAFPTIKVVRERYFKNKELRQVHNNAGTYGGLFIWNAGAEPRASYLKELMTYISLDSFSAFMHNKEIPTQSGESKCAEKMRIIGEYEFCFAFENTLMKGYVTEKYFQCLVSGAIPVVFGTPEFEREGWEPFNDAVINALDYESPKELADYLKQVVNSEELQYKHKRWMYENEEWPIMWLDIMKSQNFVNSGKHSFVCRACEAYVHSYCK